MKQYDNHFAVAVMICLKEIIFYTSSYLNFRVGKYTIFLFSTVGRNIAANASAAWRSCVLRSLTQFCQTASWQKFLLIAVS